MMSKRVKDIFWLKCTIGPLRCVTSKPPLYGNVKKLLVPGVDATLVVKPLKAKRMHEHRKQRAGMPYQQLMNFYKANLTCGCPIIVKVFLVVFRES